MTWLQFTAKIRRMNQDATLIQIHWDLLHKSIFCRVRRKHSEKKKKKNAPELSLQIRWYELLCPNQNKAVRFLFLLPVESRRIFPFQVRLDLVHMYERKECSGLESSFRHVQPGPAWCFHALLDTPSFHTTWWLQGPQVLWRNWELPKCSLVTDKNASFSLAG